MLSQEIYRTVLENLPTGVYLVDRERRIQLWSHGAEELTGLLRQQVIGRSCGDLLMPCNDQNACLCPVACPAEQAMHDGKLVAAEAFLRHKDGQLVPVEIRVVPLRDEHGTIIGAVEWFGRRPVLPVADPGIRGLTAGWSRDELTGLPNRAAVLAFIGACLQSYAVSPVPFGVLAIAVDGLDLVRHAEGWKAVQALQYGTAQTLADSMGPNDMIGRWSEERFVAVMTGCAAAGLRRSAELMKRLVQLEGVPWWGDRLQGTVSLGGAIVEAGDTPEGLVGRAEAALEGGSQGGDLLETE